MTSTHNLNNKGVKRTLHVLLSKRIVECYKETCTSLYSQKTTVLSPSVINNDTLVDIRNTYTLKRHHWFDSLMHLYCRKHMKVDTSGFHKTFEKELLLIKIDYWKDHSWKENCFHPTSPLTDPSPDTDSESQ